MSFDLEKESVSVYEPLKAANLKTVVNADIIVPDTKPDVINILEVNALPTIREKYVQKDKICVSGMLVYTVLYSGDTENGAVRSIRYKMPFSEQIELLGAREDMSYYAECDIAHTEYRIENSRKISVRSVLSFNCGAAMRKRVLAVSNVSGEQEIPVRHTKVKVLDMEACSLNVFSVSDSFRIPESGSEIDEILKTDIKINKNEQKIMNGKLVVKGSLLCDTLYTIDGEIYHIENEIPYTEVIDADDVSPSMHTEVNYKIYDAEYDQSTSEEGNQININVGIEVLTKAFSENEYQVVSDVYCPDYEIDVSEENVIVYSVDDSFREAYSVNESLCLSESSPSILKVYNIVASPVLDNVVANVGYIQHDGHLDVKILYLSDSQSRPVCSANKQLPFSIRVNSSKTDSDTYADSIVELEHISYVLKSDKCLEIRASLDCCGKVTSKHSTSFITDISLLSEVPLKKKKQAGVTIYFADQNETLWDIAKRYNTTEEEIALINGIEQSAPLRHRQQLLIPKRVII